jgi:hypothetical protein
MSVSPAPSNTTSIFNANEYSSTSTSSSTTVITTTGLTVEEGYSYFVGYPSAQGAVAFPSGMSCTNLTSTNLIYGSSIETTNLDAGDSEILDIGLATTTTNIGTSGTGTITIGNSNKPLAINSTTTFSEELLLTTIEGSSAVIDIGLATTTTNIGTSGTGTITIGNSNKPLAINSTTTFSEELLLTTIEGSSAVIDIGLATSATNIGTSGTGTITVGNSNKPLTVNSQSTFSNDIILSTTGSYLQFPDGTQQTTASSASSTIEIFTLTSTNTATNNWVFELNSSQNDLLYGSFFQYFLYTGNSTSSSIPTFVGSNQTSFSFNSSQSMNIVNQSQIGSQNVWSNTTTISSSVNFNYFYAYGIGVGVSGQFTDSVVSLYDSQTYSYTADFYNYYLDIINSNGNTITITSSVQGFGVTNTSTAIPSVNTYPTNYLTINASSSILSAQTIKMTIIKFF